MPRQFSHPQDRSLRYYPSYYQRLRHSPPNVSGVLTYNQNRLRVRANRPVQCVSRTMSMSRHESNAGYSYNRPRSYLFITTSNENTYPIIRHSTTTPSTGNIQYRRDWQTAVDPFVVLGSETDQPVHRPPLPSFATGNIRGNAAVYSEAASFGLTRHSAATLVFTRRHDNVVLTAPGHDHAIMIAQRQPTTSFPRRNMNQHALMGGLSRSRGPNREVRSDEYSFVRTFAHPTAMSGIDYDDSDTSSNSRVYPDSYGPRANQPTNTTAYADKLTEYEVRPSSVNLTHPSDGDNAQPVGEYDNVI